MEAGPQQPQPAPGSALKLEGPSAWPRAEPAFLLSYGLCVSSPKVYMEALTPSVMVFGGAALGQ